MKRHGFLTRPSSPDTKGNISLQQGDGSTPLPGVRPSGCRGGMSAPQSWRGLPNQLRPQWTKTDGPWQQLDPWSRRPHREHEDGNLVQTSHFQMGKLRVQKSRAVVQGHRVIREQPETEGRLLSSFLSSFFPPLSPLPSLSLPPSLFLHSLSICSVAFRGVCVAQGWGSGYSQQNAWETALAGSPCVVLTQEYWWFIFTNFPVLPNNLDPKFSQISQ